MSVRHWLIKTLSQRDHIPEVTIKAIIIHGYDEAQLALKNKDSLEISGFGNFYYNRKKADKEMVKCLSQKDAYQKVLDEPSITDKKRHSYEQRMKTIENNIKALKLKSNE